MEPTVEVERDLRRYSLDRECPGPSTMSYCNAARALDVVDNPMDEQGITRIIPTAIAHDDPRWPTLCDACGYAFIETDHWQIFQQRLYRRVDNGMLLTLRNFPTGAMWDAHWYPRKGPDGRCVVVQTPAGEWMIDAPSTSGQPWTRTGEVPNITARPSILINNRSTPDYHGWLTDGVLEEI
jgi:hypothetical protein